MPHTTSRAKAAPKPQTAKTPTEQTPAPAAPTPPAPTEQSMFDETPPAPPAAEQPPVESAAPSELSSTGPDGVGGEQEDQPPAAPAPVPPETVGGDTSVGPQEVRLGQVVGLLHRLPLKDVLACADTFAEKIEAMKYTAAVQDLQSRMRVSEGRCAPVYFTADDDDEIEFLLAGDDALAAAKAIGLETVFVVTIHPRDAGALQSYLAQKASTANASTEDDELVWRANGYQTG